MLSVTENNIPMSDFLNFVSRIKPSIRPDLKLVIAFMAHRRFANTEDLSLLRSRPCVAILVFVSGCQLAISLRTFPRYERPLIALVGIVNVSDAINA